MTEPDAAPRPDRRSGLIWAVLVLTLAIVIVVGLRSWLSPAIAPGTEKRDPLPSDDGPAAAPETLPFGDEAPAFSLTERRGRKTTRAELDGKVWIANFIFTSCGSVCPDLTRKMASIRERLKAAGADDIVSVSFSVDPVQDTPEVLTRYAEKFHAETPAWLFLTGEPKEMLRVVNQGFRVLMSDPSEGTPAHSDRFILVDARGRVRATHQGSEPNVVETIVREALALRKEGRG